MKEHADVSSPLLLRFDELEEGTSCLELQVAAEKIDLSNVYFSFPRPLRIALTVHRSFETFAVQGRIRCVIRGECCRCLAPLERPMELDLRLLFQRKQATDEELDAVAEDEEIEILSPGAREVDLADRIREAVVIELPVRVYCRDDCRGLCPRCGHDLNEGACTCGEKEVDPRWEALKTIKFS